MDRADIDDEVMQIVGRFEDRIAKTQVKAVGTVTSCRGGIIECAGIEKFVSLGDTCWIARNNNVLLAGAPMATEDEHAILCEVVAIGDGAATLLPYAELDGVSLGAKVTLDRSAKSLRPSRLWQGRVIDAFGRPIDHAGPLPKGGRDYDLQARPVPAHLRGGMGGRLRLGVRALDLFTPVLEGQRLGIFAGSGVGKSSLISMIAKASDADILVIGLVGERGRELLEFLEHTLGPEGRARSVVVVATSDMPAMLRRRAAYMALTVAEYFRDCGLRVLCLLDSVTRFAMALREIYLAAGEPPTAKGYPPSVFSELPRLLERAGPGAGEGSITGLFSVLVEGDDTNEPVSDTVRGILDGHVVMDRAIAESGRFPAIDVLRSISRTAPGCYAADERTLVQNARHLMRLYQDMTDLIQLGAYQAGSNAEVDRAIACHPGFQDLLSQDLGDEADFGNPFQLLAKVLKA